MSVFLRIIGYVVALILLVVVIFRLPLFTSLESNNLIARANIALVVVTMVLVVLTGAYAWQTKRMVEEQHQARLDSQLPLVLATFEGKNIHVRNGGGGPALNVEIYHLFISQEGDRAADGKPSRLDRISVLRAGEPKGPYGGFRPHRDLLVLTRCRDMFGQEIQITHIADSNELLRITIDGKERWPGVQVDPTLAAHIRTLEQTLP